MITEGTLVPGPDMGLGENSISLMENRKDERERDGWWPARVRHP